MELTPQSSYITNSGDKAVLWVVQNMATQKGMDQNLHPIVQHSDLCGPVTLGKLGEYPIVFTNRAVSSTGDIIVNAGKLAFCPNSSWLGAQTIIVSNNSATANANLEIRGPETLSINASIYLEEGGTMTLGAERSAAMMNRKFLSATTKPLCYPNKKGVRHYQ